MSYVPDLHSVAETIEWMRETVFRDQNVLVAEVDGSVVGYASFSASELSNMYVLPTYQRRGVGTRLLAAVIRRMSAEVELWIFEDNVDAIRFYEGNGFKTVSATSGDNEEDLPDRLMRRNA